MVWHVPFLRQLSDIVAQVHHLLRLLPSVVAQTENVLHMLPPIASQAERAIRYVPPIATQAESVLNLLPPISEQLQETMALIPPIADQVHNLLTLLPYVGASLVLFHLVALFILAAILAVCSLIFLVCLALLITIHPDLEQQRKIWVDPALRLCGIMSDANEIRQRPHSLSSKTECRSIACIGHRPSMSDLHSDSMHMSRSTL